MTIPLNVLLLLVGLFFLIEGSLNVMYWWNRPTRAIFQAGRILRVSLGVLVIILAFFWGA